MEATFEHHQVDSEGASREEEGIGQFNSELMPEHVNDRNRLLAQCVNPKTANRVQADELCITSAGPTL